MCIISFNPCEIIFLMPILELRNLKPQEVTKIAKKITQLRRYGAKFEPWQLDF